MSENTVSLQLEEYDEEENAQILHFEVSRVWLEKYLAEQYLTCQNEDMYSSVENFLNEYTTDESVSVYLQAVLEDEVIKESVSK